MGLGSRVEQRIMDRAVEYSKLRNFKFQEKLKLRIFLMRLHQQINPYLHAGLGLLGSTLSLLHLLIFFLRCSPVSE